MNDLKIHIVVTTCGEPQTKKLLQFLHDKTINNDLYELHCLRDSSKSDGVYDSINGIGDVHYHDHEMNGDFSDFRNSIHSEVVEGDYIFFIDADEEISEKILRYLPVILENNSNVDLFYLPRNNIVGGITKDYISHMGWKMNSDGKINYPDWQGRIYRYKDSVKWEGSVHEKVSGIKSYAKLGYSWAHLDHTKTFDRQKAQNALYDRISK